MMGDLAGPQVVVGQTGSDQELSSAQTSLILNFMAEITLDLVTFLSLVEQGQQATP